jgi:hypothetical protein
MKMKINYFINYSFGRKDLAEVGDGLLVEVLVSLGLVRSAKMNLAEEVEVVSSFSSALISASLAKPFRTMLDPSAERARPLRFRFREGSCDYCSPAFKERSKHDVNKISTIHIIMAIN